MGVGELFNRIFDTLFRMLPHKAKTGLMRIGNPGAQDPVLLTCNYTLTVRRMRETLDGLDVWLLVANSRGINVWCAAGGGHLTHHDVISVVRTSRIEEQVSHRRLILPPLGATGIERRKVTQATGWEIKWGPARLEDLPAYFQRGGRVKVAERFMRFPLWERLEMALIWIGPMLFFGFPLAYFLSGWAASIAVGLVVPVGVFGLFALTPKLNMYEGRRWGILAALAALSCLAASGVLMLLGESAARALVTTNGIVLLLIAMLAMDFEGTTPWYGGVINTTGNSAQIDLIEEQCQGDGECTQVCPKAVFTMDGNKRKAVISQLRECIQCGACIVQCPGDALQFRYQNGNILGPDVIRNTRMNMAARRVVRIDH